MGEFIELIGQLKPKNNGNFPIADANDLIGGYIQISTIAELNALLNSKKVRQGMLAYVIETNQIYQYRSGIWNVWNSSSGGGGGEGASIIKVPTLEDLNDPKYQLAGQIVFIDELKDLRYFDGEVWKSFNRIYIQPTPPQDRGAIWIDTSDEKEYTDSNGVIQNLIQVITILQKKVNNLEWALNTQLDFGNFENNHYNAYNEHPTPEEPSYGTSEEEDSQALLKTLENVVEEIEPVEFKDRIPNGTHLCIKSGTYAKMIENEADFLPKELLWVHDRKQLWIKDTLTNKLIQIGSSGGDTDPDPDPEYMKQIITELVGNEEKIIGINFGDMANKNYDYQLRVVNGKLALHPLDLDIPNLAANTQSIVSGNYYNKPYFPVTTTNPNSPMIYINSVYTGGKGGIRDYNPCSHNFVELVNLSEVELNLKGLYLHYTEKDTGLWVTLPLIGKIKSGGTFLIRGSQCSVYDVNTTYIKVDTFDMEWTNSATLNKDVLQTDNSNIWGEDNKIQFDTSCAIYLSGIEPGESFQGEPLSELAPWRDKLGVIKWYIDLFGVGTYQGKPLPSEKNPYAVASKDILLCRYFNMDFVNQAVQATSARSNIAQWTHIDLKNINPKINVIEYTPKASFENKTIFFNKTLLTEGIPNIVTCTFGQNAHTTRCFNWVSKGYYDEFIQISEISGDYSNATVLESFKKGDGRTSSKNWNDVIYDRIRSITTDGTSFTSHKIIVDFPEPAEEKIYYYKVGRKDYWTEERSFTLRGRNYVINKGHDFLHVSDQQGFVGEEYETWRLSAEFISKDTRNYDFIINTGDATQNGNRINEWLDYFNGGKDLFKDKEQMYTVGNNDLAPLLTWQLGRGSDKDKMNPINVEFFFTFEHPYAVPRSYNGTYLPCVYSFIYGDTYYQSMNSEVTNLARKEIFNEEGIANIYTNQMKTWAQNDVDLYGNGDPLIKWKVSLTHEMPFTIITADLIRNYVSDKAGGGFEVNPSVMRDGSHLNTIGDYWYGTFLEDNEFNLCIGGHKHTYSNSRYIRDNVRGPRSEWKTMEPTVYDKDYVPQNGETPAVYPLWYRNLPEREKSCVQLTNDSSLHFIRYVMLQATGYKLQSNKEAPAQNIPWLMEYYPVTKQDYNSSTNSFTIEINVNQKFPHYILWNIGKGTETEKQGTTISRDRIKGEPFKLILKGQVSTPWAYKYSVPIQVSDLDKIRGNGSMNATDLIIIEKLQ